MIEYASLDTYHLEGRGKVFIVESKQYSEDKIKRFVGEKVIIDSKQYEIQAVETFAKYSNVNIGDKIGLLVKETV